MARTSCPACGAPLTVGGVFPGGHVRCACGAAVEASARVAASPYRDAASRPAPAALRDGPAAEACLYCGRVLAPRARRCGGCDVRVDRPRCAACYRVASPGDADCARCGAELAPPRLRAADVPLPCPRCDVPLEVGERPSLLECPGCAGTFLAHDALARVLEEARSLPPLDDAAPSSAEPAVRYLACPHCADRMNRSVFGGASGVVVDTCRRHGTFFDAGELPRAVVWLSRGGLARAERRRAERDREDARARRAIRAIVEAGPPASSWEHRVAARGAAGVGQASLELLVDLLFFS